MTELRRSQGWESMRRWLMILIAQLADLAAFLLAARLIGLEGERNALMAAVALGAGLPAVAVMKVAGAIGMAAIASRLPHKWGLVAVAAGLLGALTAIQSVL